MTSRLILLLFTKYYDMKIPDYIHRLVLSILFSIINWKLVDLILIDIPIWKYFIIEFSILGMVRLLIYTYEMLGIPANSEE